MGCNASKGQLLVDYQEDNRNLQVSKQPTAPEAASGDGNSKEATKHSSKEATSLKKASKKDQLYNLLVNYDSHDKTIFWNEVVGMCKSDVDLARYRDKKTQSSPLHEACKLVDYDDGKRHIDTTTTATQLHAVRALIQADPNASSVEDSKGNLPLHYAVAPSLVDVNLPLNRWKKRGAILKLLIASDIETSSEYLSRNDVVFDTTDRVTPLYHALQCIPDDFASPGPTVEYISALQEANPRMLGVGNQSDGDKPLALLYRRFTRQFDLSEKFFAGDNSRREVVEHRREYKCAAGNTWKLIEMLLRPENTENVWRIVHSAVQVDTPPDLLRYIVETNAEDLTKADADGNLPLHYAAMSKPLDETQESALFPEFYTKYVVDELLYKFPEGASIRNADGKYALTLAIESGKKFIGGGVKSLYQAYPDAIKQTNLDEHTVLKKALKDEAISEAGSDFTPVGGVVKDEQHDAIMLVQKQDAAIIEIVTSMWAYEEDPGVQMLGCMAISRRALEVNEHKVLGISLSAVAAAVNAMKAHPNEAAVQDKACTALKTLAAADGKKEVSFVALGAIAAIVGAMQAHVGDPVVQEEACSAVADIVSRGGADRATIVGSVSGLTAIVNAIAAHPNVGGVQEQGCRALVQMTNHQDEANLPELPLSQIEPLLQAAKANFPKECEANVNVVLARLT